MSVYNLVEYSDIHLKTSGSLWQYYRDEPASDGNTNITDFPNNNNNNNNNDNNNNNNNNNNSNNNNINNNDSISFKFKKLNNRENSKQRHKKTLNQWYH